MQPYDARLGAGVWDEDSPGAGFPSRQGIVVHRGFVGRFDDLVTRGWALLSRQDATQQPSQESRALLARMGGVAVTLGAAGSGADVFDTDGVYQQWFDDLGVDHLLVRPDFHTAGAARADQDVDALVARLAAKVLVPGLEPVGAR